MQILFNTDATKATVHYRKPVMYWLHWWESTPLRIFCFMGSMLTRLMDTCERKTWPHKPFSSLSQTPMEITAHNMFISLHCSRTQKHCENTNMVHFKFNIQKPYLTLFSNKMCNTYLPIHHTGFSDKNLWTEYVYSTMCSNLSSLATEYENLFT